MVLKAAVIGLGVGEQHIYGYEQGNECQVVSLCDKNHEKLKEVGLRHPGKKTFTDPEKILFDESIDIVSIATYDDSHYELIEKSIKNGKHIFVEKPLCLTTKEYNCICDLLRANPQIKVSSNLILRKSPRFINLKRKVDEGIFGEPYYFEGDYDYGRIHKILNGWRGEITNYSVDELINRQIVAVCNFENRNIAGIESEVLVLGAINEREEVILLEPRRLVNNGSKIA